MTDWFLILGWSGPVGLGIFLVCLGAMIYLLSKADKATKRKKGWIKK